jgi:ligand-binding SRPBCC domain-containing protein
MSIELDRPGGGVAAFMLSVDTLLALEKNGALAHDEASEIVEQTLTRLKTMDAETSVPSQAAWRSAIDLLEQLRARLDRDWSRRQLDYLNY